MRDDKLRLVLARKRESFINSQTEEWKIATFATVVEVIYKEYNVNIVRVEYSSKELVALIRMQYPTRVSFIHSNRNYELIIDIAKLRIAQCEAILGDEKVNRLFFGCSPVFNSCPLVLIYSMVII